MFVFIQFINIIAIIFVNVLIFTELMKLLVDYVP